MQNRRPIAYRLVHAVCALLLAIGCRETRPETTEGETHFLRACDAQAPNCSTGLTCACGVCTLSCTEKADCSGVATSATCVAITEHASAAACSEPAASAFCDQPCATDADCHVLSGSHHCVDGFCRIQAGASYEATGGAGGVGGGTGANTSIAGAGNATCPDSGVVGNEVLILGDMFIAQDHQLTAYLEQMARQAGTLDGGERFRDYSSLVDNSLALVGTGIANQYAKGQAEGTSKVVILCGGGADVLGGTCANPPDANCQSLVDAAAAAAQLLAQMASDGIQNVVWFIYPDPVDAALRAKMDLLRPKLQSVCENSAAHCHWVDLRPTFAGLYAEYIRADGMTPTAAGAEASAAAIWNAMQQNCIAQ